MVLSENNILQNGGLFMEIYHQSGLMVRHKRGKFVVEKYRFDVWSNRWVLDDFLNQKRIYNSFSDMMNSEFMQMQGWTSADLLNLY
jgi:hypothetical protein